MRQVAARPQRDGQLEHEERDRNREHAVAERFESSERKLVRPVCLVRVHDTPFESSTVLPRARWHEPDGNEAEVSREQV